MEGAREAVSHRIPSGHQPPDGRAARLDCRAVNAHTNAQVARHRTDGPRRTTPAWMKTSHAAILSSSGGDGGCWADLEGLLLVVGLPGLQAVIQDADQA